MGSGERSSMPIETTRGGGKHNVMNTQSATKYLVSGMFVDIPSGVGARMFESCLSFNG